MTCLFQEGVEPCRQETQIIAIHETLKELKTVLVQIAEQGMAIKAQNENIARHEKHFELIYPRLNLLEVRAEGEKVKVGFIIAASSTLSALLFKFLK
jgi:hypothetical protein